MAKDKFLLVSLKDEDAKKLAQVITNDTSRKILDFLAESDATETQIAQALGMPLPTVHYNLKALETAKLVVVEQFHYSSKGREVNHYKLANKYIIIAPASTYGIKEKLKSLLPVVPVIGGGALALEWYASMQSKAASFAPMEALRTAAPMAADTMGEMAYQAENELVTRAASAGAEAMPTLAQKAIEAAPAMASEAAAQKAVEAGQALATQAAPEMVRQGAEEAVRTAAPTASQAVSDHVASQAGGYGAHAVQSGGFMAHPGLWLLIGALVAVGLWIAVDAARGRK